MEQQNDKWRTSEIKVIWEDHGGRFEAKVNAALQEGWKKESRAKVVDFFAGDYMSHAYTIVLYKVNEE